MPTSIRLEPEIERRLDFLAASTGRSKAYYLRRIIERGIEEMEDYYLAADVLERVRRGEEAVHPAAVNGGRFPHKSGVHRRHGTA